MWKIASRIKWVNRGSDIKLYSPYTGEWYYLEELHRDVWMLIAVGQDPLAAAANLALKYRTTAEETARRIGEVLGELQGEGLILRSTPGTTVA